jgi:hypothetical protein
MPKIRQERETLKLYGYECSYVTYVQSYDLLGQGHKYRDGDDGHSNWQGGDMQIDELAVINKYNTSLLLEATVLARECISSRLVVDMRLL